MCDHPRGDTDVGIWCGTLRSRAGNVLLSLGGTDHARRRLGHAVSARSGMGVLSRTDACRPRAPRNCGALTWPSTWSRLPDVGEGVAQAELVEWHVKPGDLVREDAILAAVMTDKATVEISVPRRGGNFSLGADIGDMVAVGSELIRLKVAGRGDAPAAKDAQASTSLSAKTVVNAELAPGKAYRAPDAGEPPPQPAPHPPDRTVPWARRGGARRLEGERPLATPAVRLRAREAGVDLRQVPGTGPAGRITHDDLDAFFAHGSATARSSDYQAKTSVNDVKVVGLRRKIAEKMTVANARIPHITYIGRRSTSLHSNSFGRR